MTKLILRAFDLSTGATIAGDVSDAARLSVGLWNSRSSKRALRREIHNVLREEFANRRPDPLRWSEMRAVSTDVATMLKAELQSDDALLVVVKDPDPRILSQGAAAAKLRRNAEASIEPFLDRLIDAAAVTFVRVAKNAPGLQDAVTAYTVRSFDTLLTQSGDVLAGINRSLDGVSGRAPAELRSSARRATNEGRTGLRPRTLREQNRLPMLGTLFAESSDVRVLLGEGGMGKSVLAGEVVAAESGDRVVILVRCDQVPTSGGNAENLDRDFGAVIGSDGSLSSSVRAIAGNEPVRPLVVLDTLDIVTRDDTAAQIDRILQAVADHADLFVTCRETEWTELLAAGSFCNSVKPRSIYPLSAEEARSWAEDYVRDHLGDDLTEELGASFLTSLESTLRSHGGVEVLGVPLRLGMACSLYATEGALPADLTASRLYEQYWLDRIHTDRRGRITQLSQDVEIGASRIAERMWVRSVSRFVDQVPVPEMTNDARRHLESDGIADFNARTVAFFHQTFAEFAVARHLATEDAEDDWRRLGEGMAVRRSGYWAIAGHLMRRADLTPAQFDRAASAVPEEARGGVYTILTGILQRPLDEMSLKWWGTLLRERRDGLIESVDLLLGAPEDHAPSVLDAARELLPSAHGHLTTIVRIFGDHVGDGDADHAVALLNEGLDALNIRRGRGDRLAESEIRRLIENVLASGRPHRRCLLRDLQRRYQYLPEAGRAGILATLARGELGDATELLQVAVHFAVPMAVFDDVVDLVSANRDAGNWDDWSAIVRADHPSNWMTVFARAISNSSPTADDLASITEEVFDEAVTGNHRRNLTGLLRQLAGDHPTEVAAAILANAAPTSPGLWTELCHLLSRAAQYADPDTTRQIATALVPATDVVPATAWPAMVRVASADEIAVAQTITLFAERGRESQQYETIAHKVLDALATFVPATTLARERPAIEALLASCSPVPTRTRIRLAAAEASASADGGAALDGLLKHSHNKDQEHAVKVLLKHRRDWEPDEWSTRGLRWTTTLLKLRAPGAVISLTEQLRQEILDPGWTPEVTSAVIARAIGAIRAQHEPQITNTLLSLLADLSHRSADDTARPTPPQCISVLAAFRHALKVTGKLADTQRPAVFGQNLTFMTEVCKRILPRSPLLEEFERVIGETDTDLIGNRASRVLTLAVGSVARAFPEWWDSLDETCRRAPVSTSLAVAEAARWVNDGAATNFLRRLASDTTTPPEVLSLVQQQFQSRL
ncbi:NACHT domain-containing protein [Curtobacterium flaccumfaciens]|uniref:NACHT domain-containing protein n=1 Tax=Curtobacterium flaccumfaciens TaxID=2035 RepID=UPI0016015666|nr:hypothetical protein [Curtobacterium flaccumfaciens]MBB1195610.1 hypothetical protein [Curtobacterium flaccumfaciens]